jgi:DNA polymerase-3 subunit epsilon
MLRDLLQLNRPLAVLDLETTGLNPKKDRIVQIGVTIHYPDKDHIEWVSLVNPGIPIPPLNHKITDAMVADAPKFSDFAGSLARNLTGVDLMGHNAEDFDIKLLSEEMIRAGIKWDFDGLVIDTLKICRILDGHSLENAYKRYVDRKGFDGAHDAGKDVHACTLVFRGQKEYFPELPNTVEEIYLFLNPPKKKDPNWVDGDGKIAFNEQGIACLMFGKWKGTPIDKIPGGYINWMVESGSFSDEIIGILVNAKKGILPKRISG